MQDIQTEYVYKKNVTLFKELKDLSTFFLPSLTIYLIIRFKWSCFQLL